MTGYRAILRNPSFLFLWFSQILSQVADKIFFVLLVAMVAEGTASHTMMSLALISLGLPSALFGLLAGTLVDRSDKRMAMLLTNLLRALLVLGAPLLGGNPWGLILLAFILSTASQPFAPAEAACIPMVVPRSELMGANALFSTTLVGSIIAGFTLAEPLLFAIGSSSLALVVSGMYALAGLSDLGVRPVAEIRSKGRSLKVLLDELAEGWQYIRRERSIRGAIMRLVTLFAMFAGLSVLAILFAREELKAPFSWFLATSGIGMAIASALIGRWGGRISRKALVQGGFWVSGLSLGLLAFARAESALFAFALSLVIGGASAAVVLPLQTELHEAVPEALRGKVFGAQNTAISIATAGPISGAGVLADALGVRVVFLLLAAMMILAAAWRAPEWSETA